MDPNQNGIATVSSPFSFRDTVNRLKAFIVGRGLYLFAHVDHEAGAHRAGLEMNPACLLIFGSAKAGTPAMVMRPLLAFDLPLKVLVWQDVKRQVWVSYNTPEFLAQRHDVPPEVMKPISGLPMLVKAALAA